MPLGPILSSPLSSPLGAALGGGAGWWPPGSVLAFDFANRRGYNSLDSAKSTPDSILTYTSPSPKLVYGSDGVLRYAPHNLLTYSENINQGQWLATNITINSSTQFTFNTNAGYFRRGLDPAPKNKYELAVELSGSHPGDTFRLELVDSVDGSDSNFIDVVVPSSPTKFTVAADMTTATFSGSLLVAINRTAAGRSITAGSTVTITRMHLRYTPSDATYIPTTTAAVYSLPIDHNPTTFAPLGVLIEEQRTNLCLYSDDFTNAAWVKSNLTAAKTATGPDGVANSASTLTATAANATALQAITSTSAARITSMFVKRRTGTGAIEMTQDNGSTWTAVTVTAGWTRVNIASATAADPTVGIRIVTSGDAIDVDLFDHELGAFITSPKPTVASQVTRAADQVSILTSAFGYNQPAGTIVVDAVLGNRLSSSASGFRLFELSNGTANRVVDAFTVSPAGAATYYNGTSTVSVGSTPAAPNKLAIAYAASDYAASLNGAAIVATASALVNTATALYVGRFNTGGNQINGHIKRLTYFPTRRSNADLQVLST